MKDAEIEKLTNQLKFVTSQWRAACDMIDDVRTIAVWFGIIAMVACMALFGILVWSMCH